MYIVQCTVILNQQTHDVDLKRYALGLIKKSGALEQTREVLRQLESEILVELKMLGGNPLLELQDYNYRL